MRFLIFIPAFFTRLSRHTLTGSAHANHSGSWDQGLHRDLDMNGYFPYWVGKNQKNPRSTARKCIFIPDMVAYQSMPYVGRVSNYLETWPDFCQMTFSGTHPAAFSLLKTLSSYSIIFNIICSPCVSWST